MIKKIIVSFIFFAGISQASFTEDKIYSHLSNDFLLKTSGKSLALFSVGYLLYKVGLIVKYGYDSSREMYHTNESKHELPDVPRKELDKLLSSPKAQELIQKYNKPYYRMWGTLDRSVHPAQCILKELGFSKISSAFVVPENELLSGYILKMPTNFRLRTAKAIELIIKEMQFKHIGISKKYSYRLPNTDVTIVVSELIPESQQIKRNLSTQ